MKKRMYKRSLAWMLILTLAFTSIAPTSVAWANTGTNVASESVTMVANGEAGPYANWKLTSDGVLTISGAGTLYNANPEYNSYAPWNRYTDNIKEVVIQVGVTSIGNYNFWDCVNLEKITIPASVNTIGTAAFMHCKKLTHVTLPKTLVTIKNLAFDNTGLVEIQIPDSVTEIGRNAFDRCENLNVIPGRNDGFTWTITKNTGVLDIQGKGAMTNYDVVNNRYVIWNTFTPFIETVNIGEGITSVGSYSFWDHENLKHVNLPSTLETIESSAFLLCDKLEDVTFPENLKKIGTWAFKGCHRFTELNLPAGVEYIGGHAFDDCINLTSVILPNSITYLGANGFQDCVNLKTITLPENDQLTDVGIGMFSGCTSLSKVNLPDTITQISDEAFRDCVSLTEIDWPANIQGIYNGAFRGCTGLTRVVIPDTVTEMTMETFVDCTNLTYLQLSANCENVPSLFVEGCTKLTSIEVPKNVKAIWSEAFYGCPNLKEVILHEGLQEIEYRAFEGCKSLTEITIPSTVEAIGAFAFKDCTALTEVALPKAVSILDDFAFNGATSLQKITIENSACKLGTGFLPDETKTIVGYDGSTAYKYADLYGLNFISLGKASIEEWDIEIQSYGRLYYDGTPKHPEFIVKNSDRDVLVPTVDYNVTYLNDVNAGTATIVIEGIGDYTGKKTFDYEIFPAQYFDGYELVLDQTEFVYNGKPHTPKATITGPTQLVEGVDYTVEYKYNVDANPHAWSNTHVVVHGKGNYAESATLSAPFTINYLNLTNIPIALEYTEAGYTGSSICPKVTIPGYEMLEEGVDYRVVYQNNYSMGTATVYVTGMGNCTGKSAIAQFEIKANDISKLQSKATLDQSEYNYTGNQCKPKVNLFDEKGNRLYEGTDFSLSYQNNIDVGTGTVVVTGKGKYEGSFTLNFTIKANSIEEMNLSLMSDSFTYTGREIRPDIYGLDWDMYEGTHYTVTYQNNVNVGEGKVILTGIGAYEGRREFTFYINPIDIKDTYPTLNTNTFTYTGQPITPKVIVDGLKEGADYTVEYVYNVDVGLATVKITGKGNYDGIVKISFTIKRKSINGYTVELTKDKYDYTGSAIKPEIIISGLKEGVDYDVTYSNNTSPGTAMVTVRGIGNYTGEINKTFTIQPKPTEEKPEEQPSIPDQPTTPDQPSDQTCDTHSWDKGKVTTKATAKVNGKTTYTCTKCGETKTSDIYKIKTVKLAKSEVVYTGKAQKPKVTVTDSKGKTVSTANYTISYKNNTKVGKATVTVKFKGNYSGTKSITFKINPKAPTIKKPVAAKKAVTVKWSKVSKEATGYEVMVATNKTFTKGKKTVTVKKAATTSTKVSKLSAKKTYYVKVRTYKTVGKVKYYSAWSDVKTVKTK